MDKFERLKQALVLTKVPCDLCRTDDKPQIWLGTNYPENIMDEVNDAIIFAGFTTRDVDVCAYSTYHVLETIHINGGRKKFWPIIWPMPEHD